MDASTSVDKAELKRFLKSEMAKHEAIRRSSMDDLKSAIEQGRGDGLADVLNWLELHSFEVKHQADVEPPRMITNWTIDAW